MHRTHISVSQAKPPAQLDHAILTAHPLNYHSSPIYRTYTMTSVKDFLSRLETSAPHSDFGFAGQNPLPRSISSPWPPATPTATSTSPYTYPPLPPFTIRIPDQYRVRCTRFSVSQANTPAPARSLAPGLPPLQLPHPPHPTHTHHSHRSRFEYQINAECVALGFRFRRQIPPPLHDL